MPGQEVTHGAEDLGRFALALGSSLAPRAIGPCRGVNRGSLRPGHDSPFGRQLASHGDQGEGVSGATFQGVVASEER